MPARIRSTRFRISLLVLILVSCVGCDQTTKSIATDKLKNAPPRSYLGDTVRLQFALNSGGFLSLGADLPPRTRMWIFVGLNSCLMIAVAGVLLLRRELPTAVFVALAFLLAGGIGNLIDRVSNRGLVTDFLNVGFGPIRTGIFNVADIVAMAGVVFLAMHSFRRQRVPAALENRHA